MYTLCPASTIAALSSVYGFLSRPLGVASTRSAGFMASAGAGGSAGGATGGADGGALGSSAPRAGIASRKKQLSSAHFAKTHLFVGDGSVVSSGGALRQVVGEGCCSSSFITA